MYVLDLMLLTYSFQTLHYQIFLRRIIQLLIEFKDQHEDIFVYTARVKQNRTIPLYKSKYTWTIQPLVCKKLTHLSKHWSRAMKRT